MTVVGMVALKSPGLCLMQPIQKPPAHAPGAPQKAQHGGNAPRLTLVQGGTAPNKTQPFWLKEPLEEKPAQAPKEGKVELFTLFTSVDIQKDYGKFIMVYDGRTFRKLERGKRGSEAPRPGEIMHFVKDILQAAREDEKILEFLRRNPIRLPERLKPYVTL